MKMFNLSEEKNKYSVCNQQWFVVLREKRHIFCTRGLICSWKIEEYDKL